MSAKIIGPFEIVSLGSLGASLNSTALDVTRLIYASIAVDWSGDPTGTLSIEAQNGKSSWTLITGQTQALSGASGSKMFDFPLLPWEKIRVSYVRTSGTGQLTATVLAKGW